MAYFKSNLALFIGFGTLTLGLLFGCGGKAPRQESSSKKTTVPSGAGVAGNAARQQAPAGGMASSAVVAAGAPSMTPLSTGGIANATTSTTGGATASSDLDGLPTVGQTVPSSVVGRPAGQVTSVTAVDSSYTKVDIVFPAEWQCPAEATTSGSKEPSTTIETAIGGNVALAPTDCHTLAALRRPGLKAESLTQLTNNRAKIIADKCQTRTEIYCLDASGKRVETGHCWQTWEEELNDPPIADTADPPSAATEYSTTNTQVPNVDEADYLKNDGQTVYVLSGDSLHIVDAWPAPETHELARLALPGEPRRLFLSDNRLVVYTRVQATTGNGARSSNPSDQGCTYGYDCRFTSEGGHSLVIVFDVSAPAQPKELIRYEMSGGYVAARRVGSYVYTVVHDTGAPQIPGLDYTLQANSYAELEAAFAVRLAANEAAIDSQSDAYFLPWVQTTAPDGTTTISSDCGQALKGSDARGMSFVSVNAFDLAKLQAPTRTVLGTNPGYVYASPEALYLAADQAPEPTSDAGYYYYGRNAKNSVIHRFVLQGTATQYRGSVALTGHILNQFAMDERQGVLRVASTVGWVPNANVVSYLTTFGGAGGTFEQLGQIGGIAPTEDIRSVRFDDDRGFVVTFKKTDPLFVFDLSDPAVPRMMGELKIPGFSTYMHRLDQNHLMAVGFEADDQGSYAYFSGIQIQVFDVTDIANPTLMHKRVIGTRGSGSEALTNHLAFNYFAPKKMLALPITVCEGGGNGSFGNQLTFAGLMAFDISLDTGITEHGQLPFVDPSTISTAETCNKWWTDSTSLVKRSIFMDDWVYGLSDAQLRVASLSSMTEAVAVVPLGK